MVNMWYSILKCEYFFFFISTITDIWKGFRKLWDERSHQAKHISARMQVNVISNRNSIPWIMVELPRQQCWTNSNDTITKNRREKTTNLSQYLKCSMCECLRAWTRCIGALRNDRKNSAQKVLDELPPLCVFRWRSCGESQRFASLGKPF